MNKAVFDFSSYKDYVVHRVGSKRERKGLKLALAESLGCQPTYVSQVLNGSSDFSLEQAEKLNVFFGHSEEESHFFMLMIQKDRAGTKPLKVYFQKQLDEMLSKRMILTQRLGKKNKLSEEERSIYYSSWHYGAVHIAVTIPNLRDRESIASYLHLPIKRVTEILDFLVAAGLCRTAEEGFLPGETEIRLGKDSHNIIKHHSNWRNQAVESLDREQLTDLHYSAVISLSQSDVLKIKDMILEAIKGNLNIIKASQEEELYSYCIDFFSMKK